MTKTNPHRVMFYVQHLLGIGHVRRAAVIARAMTAQGLQVTVVMGGVDVPGVDFGSVHLIQLPSVRAADGTFKVLLDEADKPIDDDWRDRRKHRLLEAFAEVRPQVLLLEMFPFGRRQFRFELIPLLEAVSRVTPKPRVVSSVRDILVRKTKPERTVEMAQLANDWFDRVLVHGDPSMTTFDMTFPEHAAIDHLIRYTGYVAAPNPRTDHGQLAGAGTGEIIISIGGGAAGKPLVEAALKAYSLAKTAARTWRFLCGPNLDEKSFCALVGEAPGGVVIERNRTDFPTLLKNCVVSISQGGYNTVMDVLQAHANAIIVPFSENGENEQLLRAECLQQRGLLRMIEHHQLTPELLARSIDEMAEVRPFSDLDLDFSGAETTARIIAELADGDKLSLPDKAIKRLEA